MRTLVYEYVFGTVGIVFLADDDVAHPAERRHVAADNDHLHSAVSTHVAAAAYHTAQAEERPHLAAEEERHACHIYKEAHLGHSDGERRGVFGHCLHHNVLNHHKTTGRGRRILNREMHQRQQQRHSGHAQQHRPVEAEKRLAAQQQLVNEVERDEAKRHLQRVYEKQSHSNLSFYQYQKSLHSVPTCRQQTRHSALAS